MLKVETYRLPDEVEVTIETESGNISFQFVLDLQQAEQLGKTLVFQAKRVTCGWAEGDR